MNSIRYLVSEKPPESTDSSTVSARPHRNKVAEPRIKVETASKEVPLLWRVLIVIFSMLHLHKFRSSATASAPAPPPIKHRKKTRTNSSSSALPPIPRLFANRRRKLLVLDLDETLVHSMNRGHHRAAQLVEVHMKSSPIASFYYVAKRPFCTDFLAAVLQWYDVAIFTASVSEYADPIIDLLERDVGWRCFKRRLYRDSCVPDGNGGFIKDLRVFEHDMSSILLVDNSPISFAHQPGNGLAVEGWISDPSDRTLLQLLPLLFALRHTSDVRSILSLHDSSCVTTSH